MDVDLIAKLVEETMYATQPAMILNLRACVSSPAVRTRPIITFSEGVEQGWANYGPQATSGPFG